VAVVVVDKGWRKSSGNSNDREGGSNSSRGSGVGSNGSSRDAESTTNQSTNMESTP